MSKADLMTKEYLRKDFLGIKPGMKVKVSEKFRDGDKERISQFSGIVIARKHGKGINATFTVRSVLDGIGVEKTWPLHSPSIEKIEVLDTLKVRRAKLYYIRNLSPKKLRKKLRPLKEYIGFKKEKPAISSEPGEAEEEAAPGKEQKTAQEASLQKGGEAKSGVENSSNEELSSSRQGGEKELQKGSQDEKQEENKEGDNKEEKSP